MCEINKTKPKRQSNNRNVQQRSQKLFTILQSDGHGIVRSKFVTSYLQNQSQNAFLTEPGWNHLINGVQTKVRKLCLSDTVCLQKYVFQEQVSNHQRSDLGFVFSSRLPR